MNQYSRYEREQDLRQKAGLCGPRLSLMDQQQYRNTEQAIQETLNEQDREYRQTQLSQIDDIKRQLQGRGLQQ